MALASSPLERLMRLLAIDTANWECSVALWEDGKELAFQEKTSNRDQAADLPKIVNDVLGASQIDQIIVNVGPGSFTGIRVGIAFAKGLAMGWEIPLKGMDGFMATYLSLELQDDVLILIDARRSDIFTQRFLDGVPQPPQSLDRKDLEKILSTPQSPLLAGNGFAPFLEGIPFKEATSPFKGAQRLANAYFQNPSMASEPLPFYVRDADVTSPSQSCTSSL
jgi:tRNA threonylcarbamoyladenosine biosynthesis protein TsaB